MWVYIWLTVTVIALIVEFLTSDMMSIWFAGGGLVALVLAAFKLVWYVHVPVFVVVSVIMLLCFRKMVLKHFNKGESKTNMDALIDKEFKLLSSIDFNQSGTIKVNDVVWSVVCAKDGEQIQEGAIVRIIKLSGNKFIVEEVK